MTHASQSDFFDGRVCASTPSKRSSKYRPCTSTWPTCSCASPRTSSNSVPSLPVLVEASHQDSSFGDPLSATSDDHTHVSSDSTVSRVLLMSRSPSKFPSPMARADINGRLDKPILSKQCATNSVVVFNIRESTDQTLKRAIRTTHDSEIFNSNCVQCHLRWSI